MSATAPLFGEQASRRVDALYAGADMVAQRRALLASLAPVPGERVLDLGCGPGYLARDLAVAVGPGGQVAGLDNSAPMLALALARCAGQPWVRFAQAEATHLPDADGAFDAVVCCQVLEFVADADRALGEMHRVLRPGGRLLLVDTDWESCVWASSDEARMRAVLRAWDSHCPHPQLPRTLPARLRAAGFEAPQCSGIVVINTALAEGGYSAGMVRTLSRHAADDPAVGEELARAWEQDLLAHDAQGRYFFSVVRFVFLARRP